MRNHILGVLLLSVTACGSSADMIPLVNPGFEDPALSDGDFSSDIPGWTIAGASSGAWNPTLASYPSGIPEGENVAWSNGGTITQKTGAAYQQDMEYTFEIQVGHRATTSSDDSYWILLLADAQIVAFVQNPVLPTPGNFELASLSYVATASDAGKSIRVQLDIRSGQPSFDAAALSFDIPAPATAFVLAGVILPSTTRRRLR